MENSKKNKQEMIDKRFLRNIYKYSFYLSIFVFLFSFKYFFTILSFSGGILFSILVLKSIEVITNNALKKETAHQKKHFTKLLFIKYLFILIFFYFLVKINYVNLMAFCFGISIPYLIAFINAIIIVLVKRIKYA